MDEQKWRQLFFSVGLPLIGLVLSQLFPNIHAALCDPVQHLNRQSTNALSISGQIDKSSNRISEWVDRQDWGDYPVSDRRGWA